MKFRNFTYRILFLFLIIISFTCITKAQSDNSEMVEVTIDLVNINDDRVQVTVLPPAIGSETITYQLPKIIPGTYAIHDYGRFIDDFKAYDESGNLLKTTRQDVNTWVIENAERLVKVTYFVNDTFDSEEGMAFVEGSTTVFSPAGTNILAGKQFLLNMCGFVGYFGVMKDFRYKVTVPHPSDLTGISAMDDEDPSFSDDVYYVSRYAELVDSPIMYSVADTASFQEGNLRVILSVYSPDNKEITAASLLKDLEPMVKAQKKFLGPINNTEKYAILVYVSSMGDDDAKGIGALEHNNSTTAIFRESMTSADLIHVISHEFFHTLTPLNVHSREIQDFDFNDPKMSAHLWMYEGITEYFSLLFQVNQGLMTEVEFFNDMSKKEKISKMSYKDSMSFTEMSSNVLDPVMKVQYTNVYMKGALLAMCIDLIIRDKSNGHKGILDMMGDLSKVYGPDKPFEDSEILATISELTYPEVSAFIDEHIVKGNPVDYIKYLKLAGVERSIVKAPVEIAVITNNKPYIRIDTVSKKVTAIMPDDGNVFLTALGVKNGDQILEINSQMLDASGIFSAVVPFFQMKENVPVRMKVIRDGKEMGLTGILKLNYEDTEGYKFVDVSKENIKEAWLRGTM